MTTAMPPRTTRNRTACAPAFMVTLAVVCVLVVAHGALAFEFGGSPIISYGQRFKIFSLSASTFCRADCAQTECAVLCDVDVANMDQATYFALGGSCGRVVSSNLTMNSLYIFNGDSCESRSGSIQNPHQFRCDRPQCGVDAQRFNFHNVMPPSDGWLRGNDSVICMREAGLAPPNNWCIGQGWPGSLLCMFPACYPGFKFVIDE
ncbi:hypothetical protein pkur_cds_145 [Pandoravirus kuranda]|uniref:Uncharacterized protein n=2 Tax=Pandoravirus TaxID=2060084 RepID=A0AA95EE87_9VIRU|nr:hypothetical protein pneo_cds_163 [Pandoravirus neocaledonia]AVK75770.1 hypothetical protein pneo_cds_163 [Pandoravirus neocaledonia]WBR14320.1 hypothetical protein pkur_cds_145 [Pandoravirus kuranda]